MFAYGGSFIEDMFRLVQVRHVSMDKSPGLVVVGGDSCSKGCVFESQDLILDGHFSHILAVSIEMFV